MKILHLVIITVFLIISTMLLTTPYHAYASTCAVKETIYSAPEFFLLSDNVFVGNVTSITDYGNHQWQVHFNIEKIWKGFATRQTSTVMAHTLQACGYSITVGEKYLIYTNGSPSTINPISSKMYSDAQNDIALFDDPKFQAQEQVKEELNKKLEVAKDRVGSMMMDKSSHIPIVGVGVDQVNSTLDIIIDDEKATLSEEQYTQNLKNILGDIPIKVEFGHATTLMPILHSVEDQGITTSHPIIHGSNSSNVLNSPLKQFKSGVNIGFITCKSEFYFVLRSYDRDPMCLKSETISKLASRGFLFATSTSNDNHTTVIISPGSENQASPHTYSPDVVTVVLGVNNTVRWVNQADVANTIVPDMPLTQNGKSFGSDGVIKPGQSYQFTFTEPGTFAYHTEPHPWMKGTVIVLPLPIKTMSEAETVPNTTSCNTPYELKKGFVPVLYMPTNSIGKICVHYTNWNKPTQDGIRIFEANDLSQDAKTITISGSDTTPTGNSTFVYMINSGNKAGFYGISFFCGGIPFAVGYDNQSRIFSNDFPWLGKTFFCPALQFKYDISGIAGIGIKYIPYK